eukprot:g60262.t1
MPINGVPRAAFLPLVDKQSADLPKLPNGIVVFFLVRFASMTKAPKRRKHPANAQDAAQQGDSKDKEEEPKLQVEKERGEFGTVAPPHHLFRSLEGKTLRPEQPVELPPLSPLSDGRFILALHEDQGLFFLRPYCWREVARFPFPVIERVGVLSDEKGILFFSSKVKVPAFRRCEEPERPGGDDENTPYYYMIQTQEAALISAIFGHLLDKLVKKRMQGSDGRVDAGQVLQNLQHAVDTLIARQLDLQANKTPPMDQPDVISDKDAQSIATSLTATLVSVLGDDVSAQSSPGQLANLVFACVASTCERKCGRRPDIFPESDKAPGKPGGKGGTCVVS